MKKIFFAFMALMFIATTSFAANRVEKNIEKKNNEISIVKTTTSAVEFKSVDEINTVAIDTPHCTLRITTYYSNGTVSVTYVYIEGAWCSEVLGIA
jgi:hypothetical protein